MDPTVKWGQDYVDDRGWDTARECSVHPPPPNVIGWKSTTPRHYRTILGKRFPIFDTKAGSSTD
eukprot:12893060-Heterocapsa_arctica.AAC.1